MNEYDTQSILDLLGHQKGRQRNKARFGANRSAIAKEKDKARGGEHK